ncbi:bacteriorhodopsin [Amnibacterium kyonggiense]
MQDTLDAVTPPWSATLTQGEHSLIYYFLVIAGLAMFAMFVRTWVSRNEVSSRYRPAIFAGLGVVGVAFLSYVVLVVKFDVGYDLRGGTWVPNANAMLSWAPRYFDWSVTVPLLMVELVAVSALAGGAARRVRTIGIAAAWAMIFTGFLGAVVVDDGTSLGALWIWGIVSSLCMVVLVVLVITLIVASRRGLRGAPARPTRSRRSCSS